ncbi:NUDIX domain-containing protein [Streptomyces sp. MP131-18]|uniref:NUDIX domain-containing protein n=1 Tax=Streptomyces sp. MP131-18 TaxID=1857892 RepID=UPI0009CA70B4|nr:NUDIX domain-containing protein [Streptomyces sp. MP131-18]ONK09239.1 Bifunctional NMN adenylyltransferase/Nudix hydrolase [Streptomyces sp. MP131-18]
MTSTTTPTSITTGLYEAWTTAARDLRRRYRDATASQYYAAEARAQALTNGAVHVHVVDDLGAYLVERIQRTDGCAREAYAAMLNDLRTAEATAAAAGDDRDRYAYAADVLATRRHPETGDAELLMIRRGHEPYVGALAFPGGHVDPGETSRQAAAREALEETHVSVPVDELRFVGLYDAPGRDPRGRVIGTAWMVHLTGQDALVEPEADDDAAAAAWVSIAALLSGQAGLVAFDHAQVIADAVDRYPIPA